MTAGPLPGDSDSGPGKNRKVQICSLTCRRVGPLKRAEVSENHGRGPWALKIRDVWTPSMCQQWGKCMIDSNTWRDSNSESSLITKASKNFRHRVSYTQALAPKVTEPILVRGHCYDLQALALKPIWFQGPGAWYIFHNFCVLPDTWACQCGKYPERSNQARWCGGRNERSVGQMLLVRALMGWNKENITQNWTICYNITQYYRKLT